MKTRRTLVGFACGLLLVLTGADCSSVLDFTRRAGPWGADTSSYRICFYVGEDGTQLMPSNLCNLQAAPATAFAFELRGEENAGVDQDGNDCGFGFGYGEPVAIVDDAFAVDGYQPSGSSDEISFNGTFDGESASGTSTKINGSSRCDIEWTATQMQNGTGGTGGGGTGGGGGETGGLGDLGDACEADGDCDPDASSLGVYCCTQDLATCGDNLGQCVEDCSQFSSGGQIGMSEGELCEDNNECGAGLFCCLVPDAAGNCDFALDQSCTCRSSSAQ